MPVFFVWNAYFLLKLYLYLRGSIALEPVLNLLFLAAAATPLPRRLAGPRATAARQAVTAVLAVALLWHESYLPPVSQAWSQLAQQGLPTATYVVSFLLGYFDWPLLAVIAGALMVSFAVRRRQMAAAGVTAVLLGAAPVYVAWAAGAGKGGKAAAAESRPTEPAAFLEDFLARESERVVLFRKASEPAFDIVIVHVCSMAWSDLAAVKLDQHEFFKSLDYVFTGFNTVSSYSNPAVMRLLRANCGQQSHTDIHNPVPPTCLLFESLESVGYRNYVVMSHDGKYGNYTEDIRRNGLGDATFMLPDKMPVQSIFFDDSKMYSDEEMLLHWLKARSANPAARAAVYFNSVNLHAGSHWVDEKKWWARDRHEQYEDFASFLLHGLVKVGRQLEQSGRNTVLVFVAEHGRALQTNPMQGKDLRDIPVPGITRVPLGIRLIGPGFRKPAQPVVIDKPTSYLALAWLLARFVEKSPFGPAAEAPAELARKVPATDFVSEHQGTTIVRIGGDYFMNQRDKSKDWVRLTPAQTGE